MYRRLGWASVLWAFGLGKDLSRTRPLRKKEVEVRKAETLCNCESRGEPREMLLKKVNVLQVGKVRS